MMFHTISRMFSHTIVSYGGAMEGLDKLPGKLDDVTYNNFLNNFPHNYFLC